MFDTRWFINSVPGMRKMIGKFAVSLFVLILLLMACGCITPETSVKPAENQSSIIIDHNVTIPATSTTIPVTIQPTAPINPDLNIIDVLIPGPFLTKGEELTIQGMLRGEGTPLRIWLIGDNFSKIVNVTTHYDGSFKYSVNNKFTSTLPAGPLFVIVQSPGPNKRFDINYDSESGMVNEIESDGPFGTTPLFDMWAISAKSGADAGNSLVTDFQNQHGKADDIYRYFIINVEEASITINPSPNQTRKEQVAITGITNLYAGDDILVEVVQLGGINDIHLMMIGNWSVITGTSKVLKGNDKTNTWEFLFNASGWPPDTYHVSAMGINVDTTAETIFKLE